MSMKKSWFCFIKTLFSQETQTQQVNKKCKRRRWLFGRQKKPLKALTLPEAEVSRLDDWLDCGSEGPECMDVEHHAATKIQTSYRGHLARKALRALKGIVILQAIIRGQAVRRQAATTLRCLQSIVSIQSEICARRRHVSQGKSKSDYLWQEFGTEKPKLSIERRSECRLPTKEDEINIILTKKEAILRRQRIKTYTFNHRRSTDSEDEDVVSRRKYCQISCTEDGLHPSSTANLPTYMAATKSAKAKTRMLSSPRLRPTHFDSYSDGDSPYKYTLSQMSTINSDATSSSFSQIGNKSCHSSSQQNSPSLKGVSGPVRSNRIKD